MRDLPEPHDQPLSPDLLLRRAAAGDAARASELLAYVPAPKLLDAVVTQAELAVNEDHDRPAGIDAIAELDRAAIEVMDLPQGADLSLDLMAFEELISGSDLSFDEHLNDETVDEIMGFDQGAGPVLIGWELVTVLPEDLEAAAFTVPARPWHLALVAFVDQRSGEDQRHRKVAAATADGRMIAVTLRLGHHDETSLIGATVTRDPEDLGELSSLATHLQAAMRLAASGG